MLASLDKVRLPHAIFLMQAHLTVFGMGVRVAFILITVMSAAAICARKARKPSVAGRRCRLCRNFYVHQVLPSWLR